MDCFKDSLAPAGYAKAESLPFVAGLLVAATVALFAFRPPASHYLSWPQLFGMAVEHVLTVSLVCAIGVSVFSTKSLRADKVRFADQIRRGSTVAVWLAPLVLFIHQNSVWTMFVAAVFSVVVASSFNTDEAALDGGGDSLLTSLRVDGLPLWSRFGLQVSVLAALAAQVGIIAALGDHALVGALLVGAAFASWGRSLGRAASHAKPPTSARAKNGSPLLALFVATALMIAGLMPYLRYTHRSGGQLAHRGLFPHRPSGGHSSQPNTYSAREEPAGRPGGPGEYGIVLWPEKQNYTKLVAPAPIVTNALSPRGDSNPLIIPFDGVYWFFKSPDLQPPQGSRQAHASPDKVEIRSTDRRPLSIEAHDHLANLINLDCCSRIQVAIRNADEYPETVSLELVLVNTAVPRQPQLSLGQRTVSSTPRLNLYNKRVPVDETLSFAIPTRKSLHSFDEVKIVFRLDQARTDAGARIAIDHFVLVPRGL
jgi:hypothetical protein